MDWCFHQIDRSLVRTRTHKNASIRSKSAKWNFFLQKKSDIQFHPVIIIISTDIAHW